MIEVQVVIAGNHESHFMGSSTTVQDDYKTVQMLKVLLRSATFLSDSGTKILGLTIWGSPWQVSLHKLSRVSFSCSLTL